MSRDESIEGTPLPFVRVFDLRHVERHCTSLGRERRYALRVDIVNCCGRVQEAPNEPRAREAIDLGARSGDPARRRSPGLDGSFRCAPALEATFQTRRVEASCA